jgi:glucokinase
MNYALGLDLGGSSVKCAAVTLDGRLIESDNRPFDPDLPMDFAVKVKQAFLGIQEKAGGACLSIGLSAPGLAATDGRSIAFMPGWLEGLQGLIWQEYLAWSKPIPTLNDAHAALLGESWIGAAKGFENVVMLTLGTGVGGAALVNGQLLRGEIGRGGHFGHTCLDIDAEPDTTGAPGSIETMIGNYTVEQRSGGKFPTTRALVEASNAGDAEAQQIWMRSVQALACAVCSFINIIDPAAVIIGGGIAKAGKSLFDPLEELLRKIEWQPGGHKVRIIPAQLGDLAGAYGAAWTGMQALAKE